MPWRTRISNFRTGRPHCGRPVGYLHVVLVGPSGAGKTTLARCPLVAAGVLELRRFRRRRRLDGVRLTTRDPLSSSVPWVSRYASLQHNGIKVNLIDTPVR